MPELPEVETIKNILKSVILHKTIAKVDVFYEKVVKNDLSFFKNTLLNKTILDLERIGKYLIFHLSEGFVIVSHLRMEGKYFYYQNQKETINKHGLVLFTFTDQTYLEYNDTRRFGMLKLTTKDEYKNLPCLKKLGPEPSNVLDFNKLFSILKRKSIPIKAVLLDQTFLSGIGNIYADEILFKTKVHPETPANFISLNKLKEIVKVAVEVLDEAILNGGSTIRSYKAGIGIDGNFQTKLYAYGRENQPCLNCSSPLKRMFVSGRGTTYCPKCQKNPNSPYILGITGPIASGKSSALNYFKENGYIPISGDEIVHKLYQDPKLHKPLIRLFNESVIKENSVDKAFIAHVIIGDGHKKYKLEQLIHPLVEKRFLEIIKKTKKDEKIAVEMPLLFEAGLDVFCDETLYLDVNLKTQTERLSKRFLSVKDSLKLNQGFNVQENKKKATYIISNNNSLEELYIKLAKIIRK